MNCNTTDYKQLIIDSLDVLRKRDVANKQVFKAKAYAKVISQLKDFTEPITSLDDIKNIKGIGEKIQDKITEIIETGHLTSAELAKELYNIDALEALQNIYGVGPVKATNLVKAGITSIKQLRDEIKKTPDMLNDNQKIGLKYYEDLLERIPRVEMEEHKDILHMLLPNEMEHYHTDIVGSFRRQSTTSGDIDVLIRVPSNETNEDSKKCFTSYVTMLKGFGYITDVLAFGEHKCMAVCSVYNGKARRLDLLMTPDNEYAYALLYFTGSDKFNVAFRQYATNKGYTLNEHTLTPLRSDLPVPPYMENEKDIFNFLGLRYIEPSRRVDEKQIIPKARRQMPKIASA
jgi:DNA polymerase/3'-5' exonuclease PolX